MTPTPEALEELGDLLDAAAELDRKRGQGGASALLLGLASLDAGELAAAIRSGAAESFACLEALYDDARRLRRDGGRLGLEIGEGLARAIEATIGAA